MSEEIIKVLDALCEKFGIVVDWTSASVVPYIEQLCAKFIRWEIATSVTWLVIGVIFAIIGCLFIKPAKKKWAEYKKSYYDGDFGVWLLYCFILGICILVAALVIPTQVFDIVECYTFPEKTIFDYIQMHINNNP